MASFRWLRSWLCPYLYCSYTISSNQILTLRLAFPRLRPQYDPALTAHMLAQGHQQPATLKEMVSRPVYMDWGKIK
jgi:hypothetical protein